MINNTFIFIVFTFIVFGWMHSKKYAIRGFGVLSWKLPLPNIRLIPQDEKKGLISLMMPPISINLGHLI